MQKAKWFLFFVKSMWHLAIVNKNIKSLPKLPGWSFPLSVINNDAHFL